jgi:hypothetical protein
VNMAMKVLTKVQCGLWVSVTAESKPLQELHELP